MTKPDKTVHDLIDMLNNIFMALPSEQHRQASEIIESIIQKSYIQGGIDSLTIRADLIDSEGKGEDLR